jgi:hypothetical protein
MYGGWLESVMAGRLIPRAGISSFGMRSFRYCALPPAETTKWKFTSMKPSIAIVIASIGVFLGSLLSDSLLGDGIHPDDINQAAMVAVIAAALQWWLLSRKQ